MWFFKDHATGQSGDEIHFVATHYQLDPRSDFKEVITRYADLAGCSSPIFTAKPTQRRPKKKVNLGVLETRYELCPIARSCRQRASDERKAIRIRGLCGNRQHPPIAEARRLDEISKMPRNYPAAISDGLIRYPAIGICTRSDRLNPI